MKFEVISPPEKEPVSLEEVKLYLRNIPGDDTEDDAILLPMIAAAREFCENRTGRSFAVQTLAAYPQEREEFIPLPRPPFIQIEEIRVRTSAGKERILDPADYEMDKVRGGVSVRWPREELSPIQPIRIAYRAGYQDGLPKTIRQAILLLIGHWYENREAVVVGAFTSIEIELTVKALLSQYKVWWF